MAQQFEKEEYLQKCLRDYINDDFVVEQALFLFSYMIKNSISHTFTKRFRNTAQHLIDVGWIDENGKVLIGIEEARNLSSKAQDEIDVKAHCPQKQDEIVNVDKAVQDIIDKYENKK